ncbi:MAG: N-acetyltransferase [Desulfobacterota bacterium]|nr:N-acetyltransferase [Thermodesulfobacteriota bacterium]MDW8001808.1 N-acetyltransferase [Deltaproteobacteria bacterium]
MLRKALPEDIRYIHKMINASAAKGEMLPRSLAELYENLRDYVVYEKNGRIVGTGALHICWEDLAEIRSVCVVKRWRRSGVGSEIVKFLVNEAKELKIKRIFLLTNQEEFFRRLGFKTVEKKELPQKIWTECVRCPKFPNCDEKAMAMELGGDDGSRKSAKTSKKRV